MFLDKQAQFSAAQAITVSAVGTNVFDLGVARSIGSGEPMAVVFVVDVAADQGTGDEDYQFAVEYTTNAAQTTGQKQVGAVYFESGTPVAPAQNADLLVAGYQLAIPIPPVTQDMDERYLGVRYFVAGTSPSITVSAYLVPQCLVDDPKANYASGYSIV
jgi:hypothetical protein